MSQITILLLYLLAAAAFAISRLPRFEAQARPYLFVAYLLSAIGIVANGEALFDVILADGGFHLSVGNAASMIGLEIAVIAIIAAIEPSLRGMSAGLLLLSSISALLLGEPGDGVAGAAVAWQVRAHIVIALLSYGLLTVGAIVAIYALVQERRLQSARISAASQLFAPLETTEKLLISLTAAGFAGLTLAIGSGSTFINDLLEQHLTHKFGLSLLAWVIFGVLLLGRFLAGWRGTRAVKLYLWGFATLCVAYFGSRLILEQVFDRSWG